VVALLGARQVGKTTLALQVAREVEPEALYLDMERDSDRGKLVEAELFLGRQAGRLVIIDEVQRRPDLFPLLRSLVDQRIRGSEKAGHFLVLGSTSRDLLRQSSESLAGRISYFELGPFTPCEVLGQEGAVSLERLWLRGGFPPSTLAAGDDESWAWRTDFIATYLERDIPQLGLRLPAEQLRRLWTMLAHGQGDSLNVSRLARSLGVDGKTVRRYLDVLTDLYMVRQLPPWSGNVGKRLVKSPKTYVRDSGLLHRLLRIPDLESLEGHPACGSSWEGFVIESVLARLPDSWEATYFRTAAQAEIDLVLEGPGRKVVAIGVKRSLAPKVNRGFLHGCEDVRATHRFFAMPAGEARPLGHGTEALALPPLLEALRGLWQGRGGSAAGPGRITAGA